MIRTPIPFNTGLGKRKLRLPGTPGLRAGVFGAEPPLPGFRAPRVVRWPAGAAGARSRARAQPSRRTDRPASGVGARWRPEEPGEGDRGVGAPEPRLPLGPLGRGAGARRCRPTGRGGGVVASALGLQVRRARSLPCRGATPEFALQGSSPGDDSTGRRESGGSSGSVPNRREEVCSRMLAEEVARRRGSFLERVVPHICPPKPFACVVVALAKRCHCALALGLAMRRRRGGAGSQERFS